MVQFNQKSKNTSKSQYICHLQSFLVKSDIFSINFETFDQIGTDLNQIHCDDTDSDNKFG